MDIFLIWMEPLYSHALHEVSNPTFKMLETLQKQNHFVALATSRCQSELKNLPSCMRNYKFDCIISDGGALILDARGNVMEQTCIPDRKMKELDRFCKENHLMYRYSTKGGNYFGTAYNQMAHDIYFRLYLNAPVYKPYDMDEVLNVLIFCPKKSKDKVRPMLKGLGVVEFKDCFEVRANGVDKASAIKRIMQKYVFDCTYCFGDGTNDIDMLKLADVGVAMGNACEELKEVADVVIGSVNEDGIYTYLKSKLEDK